jgi:hypothetical protein
MVDLWSKCPIHKLWKIFKSASMQNFTFSVITKYFFQILFPSASEIKRKMNFKIRKGSRAVFSASAQHRADPRPNSAREPAYLPLPHRRHWQTRPTSQGHLPPPPPPLRSHVLSPAKFPSSSRAHIECSHHLNVHMSICHREPSHHLLVSCSIASTLPTVLLPPVAAPTGMPAPGAQQRSLALSAPLAELMRPKTRHLGPCIAMPARTCSRVGAVH